MRRLVPFYALNVALWAGLCAMGISQHQTAIIVEAAFGCGIATAFAIACWSDK